MCVPPPATRTRPSEHSRVSETSYREISAFYKRNCNKSVPPPPPSPPCKGPPGGSHRAAPGGGGRCIYRTVCGGSYRDNGDRAVSAGRGFPPRPWAGSGCPPPSPVGGFGCSDRGGGDSVQSKATGAAPSCRGSHAGGAQAEPGRGDGGGAPSPSSSGSVLFTLSPPLPMTWPSVSMAADGGGKLRQGEGVWLSPGPREPGKGQGGSHRPPHTLCLWLKTCPGRGRKEAPERGEIV